MVCIVGENLVVRCLNAVLGRNSSAKDRYVEHVSPPGDRFTAFITSGPQSERLVWRDQVGDSKNLVVESQANYMGDDAEERVIVEIERVRLPAERVKACKVTEHWGRIDVTYGRSRFWRDLGPVR